MPGFSTETWLILKRQFVFNIEHFAIMVCWGFFQLHCSYLSNFLCEGEEKTIDLFLPLNRI